MRTVKHKQTQTEEKNELTDLTEASKKISEIEKGMTEEQLALVTHYVHNINTTEGEIFKKEAITCIKKYLKETHGTKGIDKEIKETENIINLFLHDIKTNYFNPYTKPSFTFIDLFAGIGGFRIAMQNLGGKCVYSSENDPKAKITYKTNFGEVPFGDITKKEIKNYIPGSFDILCAGFPCQAFSIAGRRGGFEDTRGTLFFDTAEIIKEKKPKSFFIENVKGLVNHDRGKTLRTMLNVLKNELEYFVPEPQTINAKDFGVPQNRERLFIVGFRKDLGINTFEYPKPLNKKYAFIDVKEKSTVSTKYYLSTQYLQTLIKHKARHEKKGNGFGFEVISDEKTANSLVCGGMGRERNLVLDTRIKDFKPETKIKGEVNREGIRRMTPREWARLQGFPDEYLIPVADSSAYKQFGNSVAIPAIQATGGKILEALGLRTC